MRNVAQFAIRRDSRASPIVDTHLDRSRCAADAGALTHDQRDAAALAGAPPGDTLPPRSEE